MNLIETLKRRILPLRIEDPFFGELRYQRVGFWEGRRWFAPVKRETEFTVIADDTGPTEQQRQFFRDFEARFPELSVRFSRMLIEEHQIWADRALTGSVWDEFRLEGFEIPRWNNQDTGWQVGFASESTGYSFGILMKNWEPQSVQVDT